MSKSVNNLNGKEITCACNCLLQVAVVEYINERVYLGYIEDGFIMTFTEKPLGYLESVKFDDKCLQIE